MAVLPSQKSISGTVYKNSQMPEEVLIGAANFRGKLYVEAAESINRVRQIAEKEGLSFVIRSGYRLGGEPGDGLLYLQGKREFTQWTAWELWNNGQSGVLGGFTIGPPKYNLAANPTKGFKSNHGFGLAVDIYGNNEKSKKIVKNWPKPQDTFQAWFANNGSDFGWTWVGRTYSKIEPWHFEYTPAFDTYSTRGQIEYLVAKSPSVIDNETLKDQLTADVKTNITNTMKNIFT